MWFLLIILILHLTPLITIIYCMFRFGPRKLEFIETLGLFVIMLVPIMNWAFSLEVQLLKDFAKVPMCSKRSWRTTEDIDYNKIGKTFIQDMVLVAPLVGIILLFVFM